MSENLASCQCRALRVKAVSEPDFVVACSCTACQRRTGAAFGIGGYFKKTAVTVDGISVTWTRQAESGRSLTNHFCPDCGTTVYWTLEMRPDHVGIAAGAFDRPLKEPERVIWMQDKLPWVTFPDHWPHYPRAVP